MINLALLGKNIDHSKSPIIYKKFFEKFSYKLLDYQDKVFIPSLKELFDKHNLLGLNITSPYKGHFLDQIDFSSPIVKKLGLINCIKKRGEKFFSENTDYFAVKYFLKKFYKKNYKQFILLGNGSMAKITLDILDELSHIYDISYFHYYRKKATTHTPMKNYNKSTVNAHNLGQIGEKQDRATEVCSLHIAGSDGEAEPHGVARKATSDDCPDGQCRSRMRRQDGLKYEQLRKEQNSSVQKLDFNNGLFEEKTIVINSCSRDFCFEGNLSKNCLFWDYNYSYKPHLNKFENYVDGYGLLIRQGKYSSRFFQDHT